MAGFNLADVMSQIANFQDALRSDQGKTERTVEETQGLREEQIGAAQKILSISVDQAAIENEQKLRMEQRKKATAEAFGTDILDPANRIAYLANEERIAQDEALFNSKRASELRDTSLYDSPLEYMLTRPFATTNDAKATNAAQRATMLSQNIDSINAGTRSTIKTQEAINETFTADQAALQLEAVKLGAEDKIRTLRMNQNTAYLNDLKSLREIPLEQLKQTTNAYTLMRHEQEFQARMNEMAENRKARAEAKSQEKLGLVEAMAYYNLAAKNFGKATIGDVNQFTAMARGPMKDMIGELVSRGMGMGIDLADPTPQTVPSFVARTPGESIMTLRSVKGTLPTSAEKVSSYLSAVQSDVQDKITKSSPNGKITGDQVVAGINAKIAGGTAQEGTKVVKTPGDLKLMQENAEQDLYGGQVKNIYRAPDVSTVLTAKPQIADTKWFDTVIKPAAMAYNNNPPGDAVMRQARLAVAQKQLTIDEAAEGIATYYKTVLNVNMANEQYNRVGLPTPKGYPVLVKHELSWLGQEKFTPVDLINEVQIKHSLMPSIPFGQRRMFN